MIGFIINGIIPVFLLFMLYRNYWVFNKRNNLIYDDFPKYKKLESYYSMFLKFWIWDINKFIRNEDNERKS